MEDRKIIGYPLKNGELFVFEPLEINYTQYSPDSTYDTFGVPNFNENKNVPQTNIHDYFTPKVGEKLEFKNGTYLYCSGIGDVHVGNDNSGNPVYVTTYGLDLYNKNDEILVKNAITNLQKQIYRIGTGRYPLYAYTWYNSHSVFLTTSAVSSKQFTYAWNWVDNWADELFNSGTMVLEHNYYDTFSRIYVNNAIYQYLGEKKEGSTVPKGDTSTSGGYGGSFDKSSDKISLPSLPTISAVSTGFVDLFRLSVSQVQALSNYLWSNIDEVGEHLKKLFSNPMDAIISLSLVNLPIDQETSTIIKLGGLSTGVSGQEVSSQFVQLDCGSLKIPLFWGTFLDYSPNAKAELYLPCIGTVGINIDDILGKTVQIIYQCDILSGSCVAYMLVNDSVMYQWTGNVVTQIPYTASSNMELYKSVLQTVGGVATMTATGGVMGSGDVANGLSSAISSKPNIQRGGTISGNTGSICIKKPFITLVRAEQSLADNYQHFKGFPSNIYANFSDLSGYTEVESVQLQGMTATAEEKAEIEQLLKSGVIF